MPVSLEKSWSFRVRFPAVRPEIARDRHNIHSMYCFLRWAFPYARNFKLMKSNTPPKTKKRIPLVLRTDLIDRVLEKAETCCSRDQTTSSIFVSEEILDAMDASGKLRHSYSCRFITRLRGRRFLPPKRS